MVVAIDYFTKWVEAKPIRGQSGNAMRNFVWEHIVCRFGVPHEIVSDNGTQFAGGSFKKWCEGLNIKQSFTSVAHPQANGQVEVANRDIVSGIKARIGLSRGKWVEELPMVLWSFRTTPKGSTQETPFSLVYGTEAVIPAEIAVPTHRVTAFSEEINEVNLRENLNLLEERRVMASIREAANKQKIAKYYNRNVRPLSFRVGDWVWRKNEASLQESTGKLGPNWEGPYQIAEAFTSGSYSLVDAEGKNVPRTWHATNLKKYYV
jgi:transposase InsO family protein